MSTDFALEQHKEKRCESYRHFLSSLLSAFVQAFLLSHALFLIVAGHDINFDPLKKLSTRHYAFIVPAVILLTTLIMFARHKKLRIANRLTYHAWLFYGCVLAALTTQASVVLGIILVSIATAFYTRRNEIAYLPFYVYFIVMFTALLLRNGNGLPAFFIGLPNFPIINKETITSLLIFLPIMIMMLGWRELNRPEKTLKSSYDKIPLPAYRILLAACLLIHVIWAGWFLISRIRTFAASTYDMGIFTQMYHYMSRTGLPLTTLERDTLLSHFKIHISPILYALLPIFKVFPSAITIQCSQTVLTASGFIPVYLLAKHYGLDKRTRLVWTSLYLLLPGMIFSSFYDFHENVFLAPVLLFLLYFIAKGSIAGTAVFTLLTLMIKEDAFLYVAAVALFLLFGAKDKKMTTFKQEKAVPLAMIMLGFGAVWFGTALGYLTNHGMGPMTSRFNNLISSPNVGLLSVIPTVFLNFTLFVETLFVKSKMGYILTVLTSLGFFPLLNRKFHRLFLWIPFIVINLMSNYEYQYRIDFQYNYGSHALLFALAILTYADYVEAFSSKRSVARQGAQHLNKPPAIRRVVINVSTSRRRRTKFKRTVISSLLLLAFIASLTQTTMMLKARTKRVKLVAQNVAPPFAETVELLDRIPRDSIVVADGLVTVHLADIEELYDAMYYNWEKERPIPDYVVLRRAAIYNYQHFDMMMLSGFREVEDMSSDWLLVMRRDD